MQGRSKMTGMPVTGLHEITIASHAAAVQLSMRPWHFSRTQNSNTVSEVSSFLSHSFTWKHFQRQSTQSFVSATFNRMASNLKVQNRCSFSPAEWKSRFYLSRISVSFLAASSLSLPLFSPINISFMLASQSLTSGWSRFFAKLWKNVLKSKDLKKSLTLKQDKYYKKN